jgi:2-phospho-L-lactate guanylyltransferase (CobY/MobA/RfbA family)
MSAHEGPIDVILPAGGRLAGAFAQQAGTSVKALIELNGETILQHTLRVLTQCPQVRQTLVIGPESVLEHARQIGASQTILEGESGPENIFRGLSAAVHSMPNPASRVLIAATDLPFLTVESVTRFLDAAPNVDITAPVVDRSEFERQYPHTGAIYVPLRGAEITLGCLFLLRPRALLANRKHLEDAFRSRKSNLAMARLIGVPATVAYLTRRLTIQAIERRCEQVLHCTARAVEHSSAELAYDIDDPKDLAYALKHGTSNREKTP